MIIVGNLYIDKNSKILLLDRFEIYQMDDEYFTIAMLYTIPQAHCLYKYYKCDGWEGVLKCLGDNKIIKNV